MFGTPFYHKTFRTAIEIFGSVFNDIVIVRENPETLDKRYIRVPIEFSNQDKGLLKYKQDPQLQRVINMVVPRMGFDIVGFTYNGERKLNKYHTHFINPKTQLNADNELEMNTMITWTPVPYDIDFDMEIMVDNFEDLLQIVEQILPYFQPDFNVQIREHNDTLRDVNITLKSTTFDIQYEGEVSQGRNLTASLSFTMKTYFYAGFDAGSLIKEITFKLFDYNDDETPLDITEINLKIDPPNIEQVAEFDVISTKKETINTVDQPNIMKKEI